MGMFFTLLSVFLLICAAYTIPTVQGYLHRHEALQLRRRKLDKVGLVTNILLGILYVPLSMVAGLFGMMGEGYINRSTPTQDFVISLITYLGFFTFLTAMGSILCSVLLRRWGYSVKSFWVQFGTLFHFAFLLFLSWLLEYL